MSTRSIPSPLSRNPLTRGAFLLAAGALLVPTDAEAAPADPAVIADGLLQTIDGSDDPFVLGAGAGMRETLTVLADPVATPLSRRRATQRLHHHAGSYLDMVVDELEQCAAKSSSICDHASAFQQLTDAVLPRYESIDPSGGLLDFARSTAQLSATLVTAITDANLTFPDYRALENQALIWQGFDHAWGYNHRVNRLGDWVSGKALSCNGGTCTGAAKHSGASGSGPDQLEWSSHSTLVSTPSAEFEHDVVRLELRGQEGVPYATAREVVVPTDEPNSVALLRGFDLVTQPGVGADSLIALSISVENEWYDAAAGEFHYTIFANGQFNCDTPECDDILPWTPVDRLFEYDLSVYATVVSGEDGDFRFTKPALAESESIVWEDYRGDPSHEIDRGPYDDPMTILGQGGDRFSVATVGFQRLAVGLDDAHHMLDLEMSMEPRTYDAATGQFDADRTLFFKQWNADGNVVLFQTLQELTANPDMLLLSAVLLLPFPFDAAIIGSMLATTITEGSWPLSYCALSTITAGTCVFESAGSAELEARPVLLQFESGSATPVVQDGTIDWPGLNAEAGNDLAVQAVEFARAY